MRFIKLTNKDDCTVYANVWLITCIQVISSGETFIGINPEECLIVKESVEEVMKKISDVSSTGGGS